MAVIGFVLLATRFVAVFYVSGESMESTIHDKDTLIVAKTSRGIEYGDIVVVYSSQLKKNLCKRVIGLEGDEIVFKGGTVYRNGAVLNESFNYDTITSGTYRVGKNEVFVLGDNRNNSTDSRVLGSLPISDVGGIVLIDTGVDSSVFKVIVVILFVIFGFGFIWEGVRNFSQSGVSDISVE